MDDAQRSPRGDVATITAAPPKWYFLSTDRGSDPITRRSEGAAASHCFVEARCLCRCRTGGGWEALGGSCEAQSAGIGSAGEGHSPGNVPVGQLPGGQLQYAPRATP